MCQMHGEVHGEVHVQVLGLLWFLSCVAQHVPSPAHHGLTHYRSHSSSLLPPSLPRGTTVPT